MPRYGPRPKVKSAVIPSVPKASARQVTLAKAKAFRSKLRHSFATIRPGNNEDRTELAQGLRGLRTKSGRKAAVAIVHQMAHNINSASLNTPGRLKAKEIVKTGQRLTKEYKKGGPM